MEPREWQERRLAEYAREAAFLRQTAWVYAGMTALSLLTAALLLAGGQPFAALPAGGFAVLSALMAGAQVWIRRKLRSLQNALEEILTDA